ncbi:conserved hypothetical protein; putative inner membrane protein [Pseudomonas sp. 8AS]|uniref:DUF3302 domain-containing protein n=1 Tax=Pseudomonas sp. 8AS TaxID=2653163 RepID=UPI0012F430AA|nr:DUF3302 domain-containing protein [Pseudomonas sp. 8AS]VXA91774.1 conserved hypothetical protein; putative inner membrane protein [Pseudomonas sp. 8AS]
MLDYIALGILILVAIILFYGVIAIHDIPYEIAVHRKHPQQDAILVAGWVSLFTLHVIWPFLWIWATLYREDRGWGFSTTTPTQESRLQALEQELGELKARLAASEAPPPASAETAPPAPQQEV